MKRILQAGMIVCSAAVLAAGCGEGRAIFNVDIHSFLLADQADTIQYFVPPAVPPLAAQDTIPVSLLGGLQNSGVDSLRFTGSVNFENTSGGPGTITYEVFFDTATTNLFSGTAPISLTGTAGPGAVTTAVPFTIDVTGAIRDLFVQPSIFVGVRATISNPSAAPLQGRIRVAALAMRLIVNDQVF
jgi:hypothetical protein